jgi:stage III sporulation protein AG
MEQYKKLINYLKNTFNIKNKKKIIENSVIVIIIGVIIIVAGGSFLGGSKKQPDAVTTESQSVDVSSKTIITDDKDVLEKNIEKVLSQIRGAGNVNVLITYVSDKEIVPAYDTKNSDSDTQEKDTTGGTRNIKESTSENSVVYEDSQGGTKKPVIVKELQPVVKGVVIVADGAADPQVKESLGKAIQALLDVPVFRVQVFERGK